MKPLVLTENENVYMEGDTVTSIFFLNQGEWALVLPKYMSSKYISFGAGSDFGMVDIVGSMLQQESTDMVEDWIDH